MHRPFSLCFGRVCGKGATMSDDGIYIPPEWAPHAAIWAGWPHLRGEWGATFDGARMEIADFIRHVCRRTPVRVACGSREAYGSAWFALEPEIAQGRVSLHTLPAGDIWLRDTGPIFGFSGTRLGAERFQFNGWGGKYVMAGDTMTAGGICSVEKVQANANPFVLEGGSIDLDGAGGLLTTRECLLNPNRNPGWTQERTEAALRDVFRVDRITWIERGLKNDHTDGHIDNIARFIGPGRVACQSASGVDDPNAQTHQCIETELLEAGYEVVRIPSPGLITDDAGVVQPASHLNFVISNDALYMPVYESEFSRGAISALKSAMPDHRIIGLPARSILSGGGAFHCMTQHVPARTEYQE